MKIAILILAHKSKEQLNILINQFNHPDFKVYLHLDKSAGFTYQDLEAKPIPVQPNYYCSWGAYNVTRATFNLLKKAVKDNNDYYLLISGEDFPTKSNEQLLKFFNQHKGKSFMNLIPLEDVKKDPLVEYSTFIKRFSFVHVPQLHTNQFFSIVKHKFLTSFKKLQKKISFFQFSTPDNIYVGENWFNLYRDDVKQLLIEYKKSKLLRFRLSFGLLMEEVLPHTLLKRNLKIDNWVNDSLRFTIWKPNTGSPEVLHSGNIQDALQSNELFARKFEDIKVLKELSNKINS